MIQLPLFYECSKECLLDAILEFGDACFQLGELIGDNPEEDDIVRSQRNRMFEYEDYLRELLNLEARHVSS